MVGQKRNKEIIDQWVSADNKTLAVKYRPKTFNDMVEQDAVKAILSQQLKTGTTKQASYAMDNIGIEKRGFEVWGR